MKNKYILLFIAACMVLFTSCLEKYLDKAPESGFPDSEVFGKRENFEQFFDAVYEGTDEDRINNWCLKNSYPLMFTLKRNINIDCLGPLCDAGKNNEANWMRRGISYETLYAWGKRNDNKNYNPILYPLFAAIRTTNIAAERIDEVQDWPTPERKIDFQAQTHFARAFGHLQLMIYYGPMPYLTENIPPGETWDIARLGKYECITKIAEDFATAANLFASIDMMRRDPASGTGHLSDPEQWRPAGAAALALRGRALLYGASPLNQDGEGLGVQQRWELAAAANWEALDAALAAGFELLPVEQYRDNFSNFKTTNEHIWSWWPPVLKYDFNGWGMHNGILQNNTGSGNGNMPFQNTVDMFETADGDPLNTPDDRAAATTLGHYNEQDPYTNRDPRFYIDVLYNGAPVSWLGINDPPIAEMYHYIDTNGVFNWTRWMPIAETPNTILHQGVTHTGYYAIKYWSGASYANPVDIQYTDPLIRLAEVYLNYAEATNEAYGPKEITPGANLSAEDAINVIRARVGMPPVLSQFTTDKETFRERIKNERNVELAFEGGHYRTDLLRWMDAPEKWSEILYNIDIERVDTSATYPTGFRFRRIPCDADRQSVWRNVMWYWPFREDDTYKMSVFEPNPLWK